MRPSMHFDLWHCINLVWWYRPVSTLGKWRQEDQIFKVTLSYIVNGEGATAWVT